MVLVHEAIQIVADLREQGELELAHRIAGIYMDRLENGELRFNHLALTARLGYTGEVMDLLEEYLETDRWFSTWFLGRIPELKALEDLPRFQKIMQESERKEARYWEDGNVRPIVQVPGSGKPPYPLLVAMHGNGFNPQHSANGWASAVESGWLVFHPVARRLAGYGLHWWDTHEESQEWIEKQASRSLQGYTIDPDRVMLSGFSKGGEVAIVLALQNWRKAKGFITVGAGGTTTWSLNGGSRCWPARLRGCAAWRCTVPTTCGGQRPASIRWKCCGRQGCRSGWRSTRRKGTCSLRISGSGSNQRFGLYWGPRMNANEREYFFKTSLLDSSLPTVAQSDTIAVILNEVKDLAR